LTHTLPAFTSQDALVAIMVAVSVSDAAIRTAELVAIERQVNHMPIFAGYDTDRLREVATTVYALMDQEDGSPATSPPPTANSARPSCACWPKSAPSLTSTASTPPPSNAAHGRGT
jgi:hypothetical protein